MLFCMRKKANLLSEITSKRKLLFRHMNLKIVKIEEMEVLDKTNMYLFLYLILVWFGWTVCLCKYNIVQCTWSTWFVRRPTMKIIQKKIYEHQTKILCSQASGWQLDLNVTFAIEWKSKYKTTNEACNWTKWTYKVCPLSFSKWQVTQNYIPKSRKMELCGEKNPLTNEIIVRCWNCEIWLLFGYAYEYQRQTMQIFQIFQLTLLTCIAE